MKANTPASALLATLVALCLAGLVLSLVPRAEVSNPESVVENSSQVLAVPKVRALLSEKIVNEIWQEANASRELENLIPDEAKIFSSPAESVVRGALQSVVAAALSQEFVQSIWSQSLESSDSATVYQLEDRDSVLVLREESVALDISTALKVTAKKLGLPAVVISNIPLDLGQVDLAVNESSAQAQTAYQVLAISPLVFLLPLLLFSALLFSIERHSLWRGTLFLSGSLLLSALLVFFSKEIIPSFFITPYNDPLSASLAEYIWGEWSDDLMIVAKIVVFFSALLALLSFLISPSLALFAQKMFSACKKDGGQQRHGLGAKRREDLESVEEIKDLEQDSLLKKAEEEDAFPINAIDLLDSTDNKEDAHLLDGQDLQKTSAQKSSRVKRQQTSGQGKKQATRQKSSNSNSKSSNTKRDKISTKSTSGARAAKEKESASKKPRADSRGETTTAKDKRGNQATDAKKPVSRTTKNTKARSAGRANTKKK